MIQKVMPRIVAAKPPVRSNLQKVAAAGVAVLAGSSMANMGNLNFKETEMIIPGGLNLEERFYLVIRGKLPQSVYDRWVPSSSDYSLKNGDEKVVVNIADRYVGNIVEAPYDAFTGESVVDDIPDADSVDELVSAVTDTVVGTAGSGEDGLSTFEIWKHLAGFGD